LRFGLPGSGDKVAASATAPLVCRREDRTRLHGTLAGPVTLEKWGIATAVLMTFREIREPRSNVRIRIHTECRRSARFLAS
jgi:hypothetical protein